MQLKQQAAQVAVTSIFVVLGTWSFPGMIYYSKLYKF